MTSRNVSGLAATFERGVSLSDSKNDSGSGGTEPASVSSLASRFESPTHDNSHAVKAKISDIAGRYGALTDPNKPKSDTQGTAKSAVSPAKTPVNARRPTEGSVNHVQDAAATDVEYSSNKSRFANAARLFSGEVSAAPTEQPPSAFKTASTAFRERETSDAPKKESLVAAVAQRFDGKENVTVAKGVQEKRKANGREESVKVGFAQKSPVKEDAPLKGRLEETSKVFESNKGNTDCADSNDALDAKARFAGAAKLFGGSV